METAVKLNIEIECTPEEARRAMGLPDLAPLHERYMSKLLDNVDMTPSSEVLERMMQGWAPMNEAGLQMWRRLFESGRSGQG